MAIIPPKLPTTGPPHSLSHRPHGSIGDSGPHKPPPSYSPSLDDGVGPHDNANDLANGIVDLRPPKSRPSEVPDLGSSGDTSAANGDGNSNDNSMPAGAAGSMSSSHTPIPVPPVPAVPQSGKSAGRTGVAKPTGFPTWGIALLVTAGVMVLVFTVALWVFCGRERKKRRRGRRERKTHGDDDDGDGIEGKGERIERRGHEDNNGDGDDGDVREPRYRRALGRAAAVASLVGIPVWIGRKWWCERKEREREEEKERERRVYAQMLKLWESDEEDMRRGSGDRVVMAGNVDARAKVNLDVDVDVDVGVRVMNRNADAGADVLVSPATTRGRGLSIVSSLSSSSSDGNLWRYEGTT